MTGDGSAKPVIKVFTSWRQVPKDEYRTPKEWKQVSRLVKAGEKPTAKVIRTEVLSGLRLTTIGDHVTVLYEDDQHAVVVADQWPLYHISQTRPAKIAPRTLAMMKYLDIFFRHARKDQYITRQLDPATASDAWITVTAYPGNEPAWKLGRLTEDHVRQHVNHTISRRRIGRTSAQRHTIGVKSTELTRFIALDVDHHAKDDTAAFLRRVQLLLDRFHGNGWHYQVRDGTITGIHFIKVFDKAVAVQAAHESVLTVLQELDHHHPDLDFLKLEIYPTTEGNGFRLPLAKNYIMILDGISEPVIHRGRKVGDVERYIAWLCDENRQYFAKDRLLSFLRMNVDEKTVAAPDRAATVAATPSQLGKLRGCCWPKITGYWRGEWNPPNCLDAVIAVTARIAYFFGHSEHHTVNTIAQFVRDLPAAAHNCSGRLINQDWKEIDRCITKQVARIYQHNAGQRDAAESDTKLHAAVAAWSKKGLDILDKTTWDQTSLIVPTIDLSDEDKHAINSWFAPVLGPLKHQAMACDVAIAMATLVDYKMNCNVANVRQRAVSYSYWRKFLYERFGINTGNRNKVANILKTATELGIIKQWCGSSRTLKRGTIYEPGNRLKKYITKEQANDPLSNGSILFAYHFGEDYLLDDVNNEETAMLLTQDVAEAALINDSS